jgi:hypothetical protein
MAAWAIRQIARAHQERSRKVAFVIHERRFMSHQRQRLAGFKPRLAGWPLLAAGLVRSMRVFLPRIGSRTMRSYYSPP